MKPNEHIAPFLAQPVNLKVGLNHLGYRNAAEDLFTTLLPGLNNVTARIRYYSFYCWLLDKFFESREEPTIRDYQRFVRCSEYLIAILHAGLEDAGGIPGIDYALTVMQDKPDAVDLLAGAFKSDGNTRGTYWANKGGVLVQYYGNSLRDIGITVMLGIDRSRIVVGGESAGGGLTAALCICARDKGEIPIAAQFPLYPMLDSKDTASSADNHGRVWNTKRNHWGWRHYLGDDYGSGTESKYASPARETDYSDLPPCYTFVQDGEPFCQETQDFVEKIQSAGVDAKVDVYHGDLHAFDMLQPGKEQSKLARERLCEEFERLISKQNE